MLSLSTCFMSYGHVLFGFRREPWIAISPTTILLIIKYYYITDSVVPTSADSDFYFAVAAYLTSLNVQCLKNSMLFWTRNTYMAFIFRSPH